MSINLFGIYLLSFFSKKYKQKYYTLKYRNLIYNCSSSAIFQGKLQITDYKQLHIGREVKIGSNITFKSEGGIYIANYTNLSSNQILETYNSPVNINDIGSETIGKLKPIFIKNDCIDELKVKHNFFVVSTGRSGSNTIADFLCKHPDIDCRHENYFSLIRLSTEYAHGIKNKDDVKNELEYILKKCDTINSSKNIIGDSDQKYSNLISIINEILPNTKFIWLIRKADDFVASAYSRRWFDDAEYAFPYIDHSYDTNNDYTFLNEYRIPYSIYRLNGYKCRYFEKEQWHKMSCFERCCWYWYYWNTLIEKQLENIPIQNKLFIKLEEIGNNNMLFDFLGVLPIDITLSIKNKAKYSPHKVYNWNIEQKTAYEKWCSSGMKKWYGYE